MTNPKFVPMNIPMSKAIRMSMVMLSPHYHAGYNVEAVERYPCAVLLNYE